MLSLLSETHGNTTIFRCSGSIVVGEEAWSLYNSVISQTGTVVVLDLRRVSRIDAGGLGVLTSLRQWGQGAGVKLQLIPSQAVQDLLDLTGLSSQFASPASAEAAFTTRF